MAVARQISLPDLVSEKKRNTAMSLSEGFPGFDRKPALAATAAGFTSYNGGIEDANAKLALAKILPVFYRTRQFVLNTEKSGLRVPQKLKVDLKNQEQMVTQHLRALHPLFFQRFDELQLDRLLRAMPFLRLSQGRYIFGGENEEQAWKESYGESVFLLLCGRVNLYPEPAGKGIPTEVREGAIFGEQKFRLGDEGMRDLVAASAKAEEPAMVGMLTSQVLETAFADRAFGNKRIAQMVYNVPALARIVKPEKKHKSVEQRQREAAEEKKAKAQGKTYKPPDDDEKATSDSILGGLRELSKISTAVHVPSGHAVRSDEPLSENVLVVSKGGLEVRGDVTLTERVESLPPKKVRINVHIERAEKLAGDSLFDKLDPYCKVKMGDFKIFQTPVMQNAGPNPKFDYEGVLAYSGEEEMFFTVMDQDRFSADDLCGNGVLRIRDLPDGWHGKVDLKRPKRGIYKSDSTHEEDAGRVVVTIKWDTEPITAANMKPKTKTFYDQVLFELGPQDCWGHENLMMGELFKRTLEQAAHGMRYAIRLGDLNIIGATPKGVNDVCTCWKVTRGRFEKFVEACNRKKQFTQACRVSSLAKQNELKEKVQRLVNKWETEELMNKMAKFMTSGEDADAKEEVMDPSKFRVTYRDCKAHIIVRNALNLTGGGMFDKLDPYAVVRFRGSKMPPFRTSTLEDAGSDPFWACEGCRHKGALLYNGETALEIAVFDYDKYSNDDLVATGVIPVEQFCRGFEGAVALNLPEGKKRKANMKQMLIIIGVQWDPPKSDFNATKSTEKTQTMRSTVQAIANKTF
jgi:hypothetical protein